MKNFKRGTIYQPFAFHRSLDESEVEHIYIDGMNMNSILRELIEAAGPFTSGDVVDEVDATIPLMEILEVAITRAELFLELS